MSSKLFQGFSEESSELRKQIGCITGIFQMLDRHNLHGGRRIKGRYKQKLPSGNSLANVSNSETYNVACCPQEKNLSKSLSENQRTSMESSRTSFSSSSCSSFSSVDCNKLTLQDPILMGSRIDDKSAYQSINFQKVVKDSTIKEPFKQSVETTCKKDFKQPVSCRDSPRPMQVSKSMDGTYVFGKDGKSRLPLDLNESFHVVMKLKEAPWSFSEVVEPSSEAKGGPFNRTSQDGRRFSYDGRDNSSSFLNSCENMRSSSKLKELPRLSLDSRESSMRSCNSIVKDKSFTPSNTQKELGSHNSVPSVVAKLMGLDSMPTSSSTMLESMHVVGTKATERPNEPNGCSLQRNDKLLNNSLHSSNRFFTAIPPIESSPLKKLEKLPIPQNTFFRRENQFKQKPETVYSEIEKRLKDLEFRHANKDLRALKQILDSMQAKGLLESKKNDEQRSPKPSCNKSNNQGTTSSAIARGPQLTSLTKRRNAKTYESPIVIMKPAKSIDLYNVSATSVFPLHGLTRLHTQRTSEVVYKKKLPGSSKMARDGTLRTPKINKASEEYGLIGSNGGLENLSNSVSPRLHKGRIEIERRKHSSVSSSDSRKHQKQLTNKQLSESVSPKNKLRGRPARVQGNDDQECKETRRLGLKRDLSQKSDSEMSLASQVDMDDRSADFSSSTLGVQKIGISLTLNEMNSPVAPEQPSPISVLDDTFYQDDPPVPVLMPSPNNTKGNKFQSRDKLCEPHYITSDINQKKLESIGILLQKLEELNSTDKGASTTDHIASLCQTQSSDHRYISEILLASGLLMNNFNSAPLGLVRIQLHPSGHPINPDLFLVLEQAKASHVSNFNAEKLHRKLLFDLVNEVLVQKLEVRARCEGQASVPTGQRLLKELCFAIDQLHAEPLISADFDAAAIVIGEKHMSKSFDWNDFRRGMSAIVLDIERAIFKDLVDEIVRGEASSLKQRSARRRRQLFVK